METALIDLHTHSTASDGSDTPSQLLRLAEEKGLAAIALCDHDTISGLPEFLETKSSVEAVPGIEFSTLLFSKEIHILGLYVDHTCEELRAPLEHLRQKRLERNKLIIERLHAAGFPITEKDVAEYAAGESIGRPHIARVLVEKGCFESMQAVFEKCLKRGRPFYLPKDFLQPDEIIRLIHQAGGLAFWAHPLHERRGARAYIRKMLKKMMSFGLDGVEGYYSLFTEQHHALTLSVAEELGLPVSGGSDYHGKNQPTISLGTGGGNLQIPYTVLEKIKQYRTKQQ